MLFIDFSMLLYITIIPMSWEYADIKINQVSVGSNSLIRFSPKNDSILLIIVEEWLPS